jgi:hypothetical protein
LSAFLYSDLLSFFSRQLIPFPEVQTDDGVAQQVASSRSHELAVCMSKNARVRATPLPTSYRRQCSALRIFCAARVHYLFDYLRDHRQHHSTVSMFTEKMRARQRWEGVGVMRDKEQNQWMSFNSHFKQNSVSSRIGQIVPIWIQAILSGLVQQHCLS